MSIARAVSLAVRHPYRGGVRLASPPLGNVLRVGPNHRGRTPTHPLVGADVGKIHRILLESELGTMGGLMDLYEDMRERDGRLDAVCRTRVLALVGKDWTVRPPRGFEEDKEAQAIADNVRDALGELESFQQSIAQLMDGVLRGYSVLEIEWEQNNRGWWVPRALHWRHPNRFNYDSQFQLVKYDMGDPWPGVPLSEYGPDKFIVHSPSGGRSAYPMRRGVLRSTVFAALTKRYGWRWWLVAAERFGQPLPIIKVPPGNEDLFDEAVEMLRNLTDDWQSVLTNKMELEVFPGSGNFKGELHSKLIEFVNTEMAITVLGQNLSTEVQGGSFAAATAHNFVRMDYLAADAHELEATLRRDLIEPLVRYNWPGAPVPRLEFQLVHEEDKAIESWHFEKGIVTADEVRESLGKEEKATPVMDTGIDSTAAMNGAQVQALQQVITAVATGQIPRATGVALIAAAFPLTKAQAEEVMGEVGRGFQAAPQGGSAPPSGAPGAAPPVPAPPPASEPAEGGLAPATGPVAADGGPPGKTEYDDHPFRSRAGRALTSQTSTRWPKGNAMSLFGTSGE